MKNYCKYLPVSKEEESWGISVLNTGCTRIAPDITYPAGNHPPGYGYSWQTGRILQEYQVIYITHGKGMFESESCPQCDIGPGTIILLFPGERHRYKPDAATGWDEYWIGCKGPGVDRLFDNGFFTKETPCLSIGFHESVLHLFEEVMEAAQQEEPGYQPYVSGAALHLLGSCYHLSKRDTALHSEVEEMMNKARALLRRNIAEDYTPEMAARELQLGYSWFRKNFKSYTSMSPGQYFIQLKIEKARALLTGSDLSVKEVAYYLRFSSCHYFSRLFKAKTGMSPVAYRNQAMSAFQEAC